MEPEQRAQLALPVAYQTSRRSDQHPADQAARQHLADIESGHNRFAGPSVIRQQEAQTRLRQHMLVHGNALVRQWIDQRGFGCKSGVELVAEGQPVTFRNGQDDV
jgi:hypothetical protein